MKKVLTYVLSMVMVAALAIGGTLAYVTMKTESYYNVTSIGSIDVTVSETASVNGSQEKVIANTDSEGNFIGYKYTEIMPGDEIQKEVTVKNEGSRAAYVKVTVTLNNADKINEAIDEFYEDKYADNEESVQYMYDYIFNGWGMNYGKDTDGDDVNDAGMRLTITGNDMPEHVLQVDSVKTIDEYALFYAKNWFGDQEDVIPFDEYYTTGMNEYEIKYTYYMYLEPNQSTVLFKGFNVPSEFNAEQLKMFEEFEIDIKGSAIQADNIDDARTAFTLLEDQSSSELIKAAGTVGELKKALVAGGKVLLTNDITTTETLLVPKGKIVTIDLNGKTLNGNHHKSIGAIIKNEGKLNVENGTITSLAENGGAAIQNIGTTEVENVTLNGASNGNGSWPAYTVNNSGEMIINNSKITSYHGAVASYGKNAVVTLNNTDIDMTGIPGFTSHGIYTYDGGKAVVNGGDIANKATDQNSTGASVINGNVVVNSGDFLGRIENYAGSPVIKGGTFTVKPNKWVAEGYSAVESNGKYIVIPGNGLNTVSDENGTVINGLFISETGEYHVLNGEGFNGLNKNWKSLANRNTKINLSSDIDFKGYTWTPLESHADTEMGLKEINGNGYTVKNLTVDGQAMFKRFAASGDVTIKDITFENAKVNSNGKINTSILTGQSYQNVLLDNVDVIDSTITGGYKVAPLIATVYNEANSTVTATLKNCDVINTTVKATSYDFCTSGLVAFVYADDNDKIEFENCTVQNVKLIAPNDIYKAHAFVYTTDSDSLYNEAEGVTVTDCTFEILK